MDLRRIIESTLKVDVNELNAGGPIEETKEEMTNEDAQKLIDEGEAEIPEEAIIEDKEVIEEEKTNAPNDADVKAIATKSKSRSDSTDKQTADANKAVTTNDIDGGVKSEDGIPAQGEVPEVKAQADSKLSNEAVDEKKDEEEDDNESAMKAANKSEQDKKNKEEADK